MRHPLHVLLIKPFEVLLAITLLALGIVMQIDKEVLEHAAISFETRGAVHHVWHWSLVLGSLLTLVGLHWDRPCPALRIEFVGLVILWAALSENTIALVAGADDVNAIGFALRAATVLFLMVRGYALLAQPVIYVLRRTEDR